MFRFLYVFFMSFLSFGLLATTIQPIKNSNFTPKDFVVQVLNIQTNPLSDDSMNERGQLIRWVKDSPLVNIPNCQSESPLIINDQLSVFLLSQIFLEDASYQIQHHMKTFSKDSQFTAWKNMLITYQNMKNQGLNGTNNFAEKLQKDIKNKGYGVLTSYICTN